MNKNDDKNYYILLYILLIYNIFSKRVFNFHRQRSGIAKTNWQIKKST